MSWEREALGTEVESRSCGALGSSFGSVLMGGAPGKETGIHLGGFLVVSVCLWGFILFFEKDICFFSQPQQRVPCVREESPA